ncbi:MULTISPECIES: multiple cyclophane-containing RiPP AmcA [Kitasatospora]|uniref:Uncharacterized protein n=1 Tax=Kitasatospora setae (strain ATCC 33774 / DSM 43861 / JCM 3304 / KCC A-0304 / NBRC 14216 / KM-6054) TaxID=452652 RepID=E4N0L2_KITSK|nr:MULTISPECIES: multiple cyclophane-containing RiPP AmcA [Kitasatospora]BAJ31696.1 hypothetical protein KSE_59260 [Kitasatospora setae KM-6054]
MNALATLTAAVGSPELDHLLQRAVPAVTTEGWDNQPTWSNNPGTPWNNTPSWDNTPVNPWSDWHNGPAWADFPNNR